MKNTMDEINFIDNNIANIYNSVIIVTDPPHSRRVDLMIRLFSKNLKHNYIIVSSQAKWWNDQFYFLNFQALLFSMKEFIKIPFNIVKYEIF